MSNEPVVLEIFRYDPDVDRAPRYEQYQVPWQEGLLLLGADAPHVFAAAGIPGVGEVAAGIGVVGGVALWGYGVWWVGIALLTTARYLSGNAV